MNTIDVQGLTKRFDGFTAVDGISFEVGEGELFGLLGPNGSGKTTTIRMLVGLSRPTAGRAKILGFDLSFGITEAKRGIGVVPDSSNLYDELSARENLLFMAKLYGVPKDVREQKSEELLKLFGLYERRDDRFGTFSRGMKRALTIAAALVHDPKVLFLDEPTVGLDVVAARSLRELISDLHGKGLTIVLTTHYLEEADLLCDRIAILVKGNVVEIDTPRGLKRRAEERSVIEASFGREATDLVGDLSARLPGAEVVLLDETRVKIYGGDPSRVLEEIFEFSKERNLGLNAINSIKPSLEDAFVRITGLSPTVMAREKGGKGR
ncbi:MAG: ATP-binding cassette domain-containing protein [Methanothrix sp.]|jgi:ABC-2 type transport system ATP-binding protein|uniref:ABC transporter, ATP-binding protein n=1 Tax=Methanothrix harundinacea TaxID=301375 RepID=A0A117LFZ9_9EURY|nr:MAG: ABC transporter, ATP-binding protein [Methanothrix harundinacea]MDD2638140.1 ATP-binding cassette domain-containing protein [Methanothrix sp.]MDI9398496.1 ATP-binding cassette domain-containing protein [Euryarchaeota archaeon]MCP1391839.1 ATP-binding cassette domain-containing protein [Methanothrix harundinacea]MDD3709385.1 ATP-binding cassette domain-containing protein [Methanothrix sp.]